MRPHPKSHIECCRSNRRNCCSFKPARTHTPSRKHGALATPFVFDGPVTNKPGQHSILLQQTYATASLVNEFRLGYSRNRAFFEPADVTVNSATIFTDAVGNPLPGYIDTRVDPVEGGLPRITITGFTNGGFRGQYHRASGWREQHI